MSDPESDASGSESSWYPVAGFLSGLLLMIPGAFPILAPIHVVAFVPLLLVLRRAASWRQRLNVGLLMGLGFVAPQVLLLRLPAPISMALVVYFLVLIIAFVCICSFLIRPPGIWSSLAFGACLAILDWVAITALPMWGTAQSFVRCWSWYPKAIAFASITGITGIVFVLGVVQSLGVTFALDRRRISSLAGLIAVAAIIAGANAVILTGRPSGHFKVAAVGWESLGASSDTAPDTPDGFRRLCAEPVAEARRAGVRLIVFPEAAFAVSDDTDPLALALFVDLAREHGMYLAVGYFDGRSRENRMAFFGPAEGIMERYTKTHLTPFEDYVKGTGEPCIVTIDGIRVGAMICHDDNYTDISRRYATQRADVLVIPTNDWGLVRNAHLQSTIHRAIESRLAIVRAASNGISAIISPDGERLTSFDHCRNGFGMILADVPIHEAARQGLWTTTPFNIFGHWFVAVCGIFILTRTVSRYVVSHAGHTSHVLGTGHRRTLQ